MKTVSDRKGMISAMTPVLQEGEFVFASTDDVDLTHRAMAGAIASFREAEGWSFILPVMAAEAIGFSTATPMRQITLQVYSDLEGVGLTAAVAGVLAEVDIPCNMVAATHHDHAFVPSRMAERALEVLRALQAESR